MKQILTRFVVILLSSTIIPLGFICKATFSNFGEVFKVYDASSNNIIVLSEKDYLVGALLAQIDASYNLETLKAQAVVAYTNALFLKEQSTNEFDFEVDISREILYIDEEMAKTKYRDDYTDVLKKVKTAVDSVYGEKVTFNSKIVLLPYFASSSGYTEDAYTVWGQEIEYLKPVKSTGDLLNPNSKTEYTFGFEYICTLVKDRYSVQLDKDTINFAVTRRTDSGTVTACEVGSLVMTGQDFRSLLGLCSANFDLSYASEVLTVVCYGNGHCVGMSQYGADFMARQGSSYIDILKNYYTGIEIT